MRPKTLFFAGVFFLLTLTPAVAQQPATEGGTTMTAATPSEMGCLGFIATTPVPNDLYVFDGADNDLHNPHHNFVTGDFVYLRSRTGANYAVGNEYSLVRSAKELMRVQSYSGQGSSLRSLGKPYEDVGRVRVTAVTPHGAIAQVVSACGPVVAGDLAIPRAARTSPQYAPSAGTDRFASPNNKRVGAITSGGENSAYLGVGSMAYINLGTCDGAAPGQKYRIFHTIRERKDTGFTVAPEPPRQITGELVTLDCQVKSCVAKVIKSSREISVGDGIELE